MLTNNGIWLVSILLKRHTTTENKIWVVLIHVYMVYCQRKQLIDEKLVKLILSDSHKKTCQSEDLSGIMKPILVHKTRCQCFFKTVCVSANYLSQSQCFANFLVIWFKHSYLQYSVDNFIGEHNPTIFTAILWCLIKP